MLSKKLIALAILLAGVSFSAFAKDDKKEEAKPAEHVEAKESKVADTHKEEAKSDEHHDEAKETKEGEHHTDVSPAQESKPKKTCKRKSSAHKTGDEITARLNKGEKLGVVVPPMQVSVN